jgi:hypothetical protein
MAAKLKESLMSNKLKVAWDLPAPEVDIVGQLQEKDLSEIQTLESKCKDQMVPLTFKLATVPSLDLLGCCN